MGKPVILRIFDGETGIEELERAFDGDFCVQFTEDDGRIRRLGEIRNAKYGDKHEIKSWYYAPIAEQIVAKFDELKHITVERVLFLENVKWSPPKGRIKKWMWIARIKKANEDLQNVWGYDYVMEIRAYFSDQMSTEQIVALVYHELRHVGEDGSILHHDVEDWNNMVATLGVNWSSPETDIINLLGEEFRGFEALRSVGRQLSLQCDGSSAALAGKVGA
jgi:predicted metallopeptidase